MNSISALLGTFEGMSNKFQHEDQGKHLGHSKGHQHGQLSQSAQASLYEVSLSFSSSSVSTHDKGVQVLEQELEVHFSGARFSKTSAPFVPAFEPPSADEVASNVLGFIENRIKQESDSGASPERIESLLGQARSGVEKGFGEALGQIEKLGLMTSELSEDIDQSFKKVNAGIDDLITKYVVPLVDDADTEGAVPVAAAGEGKSIKSDDVVQKNDVAQQSDTSKPESIQGRGVSAGYSSFSALSESAAIQITTQDGDIVSFNLEQVQASFERGEMSGDRFGFEATQMAGQYTSGSYNYSVDGELDEGEVEALNQLMVQIEGMSDQFFSGDFQGAFQSAMELGFDSEEIAGFSVSLSQTSVQQVSAYQQIAGLGDSGQESEVGGISSNNRFDPLAQFFDSLQAAFDKASAFSQPAQLVSSLFDRVVDDKMAEQQEGVSEIKPFEQMREYVNTLLEKM